VPGIQELIVIAVVALLVFGPDRLPEVARNAAKLLQRFRAETQRSVDELKRAAEVQDLDRELRGLGRELRETRDEVTRGFTQAVQSAGGPPPRRDAGGATTPAIGTGPPPFDPEAT
jgi:sec-independent protein translocase protein TatB